MANNTKSKPEDTPKPLSKINELTQLIVTQLADNFKNFTVEAFPDNADEYFNMNPNGAILVRYGGSEYQSPVTFAGVQRRQIEIQVFIASRHINSEEGAVEILDNVRQILTGAKLSITFDRLFPVKDSFVSKDGGIWLYAITFRTGMQIQPEVA